METRHKCHDATTTLRLRHTNWQHSWTRRAVDRPVGCFFDTDANEQTSRWQYRRKWTDEDRTKAASLLRNCKNLNWQQKVRIVFVSLHVTCYLPLFSVCLAPFFVFVPFFVSFLFSFRFLFLTLYITFFLYFSPFLSVFVFLISVFVFIYVSFFPFSIFIFLFVLGSFFPTFCLSLGISLFLPAFLSFGGKSNTDQIFGSIYFIDME